MLGVTFNSMRINIYSKKIIIVWLDTKIERERERERDSSKLTLNTIAGRDLHGNACSF